MNSIKQILHNYWLGDLDMDVTLNGRDAIVHKLSRRGSFLVESDRQRVEVISVKEKYAQDEEGNIEADVYRGGFKYVIRLTHPED